MGYKHNGVNTGGIPIDYVKRYVDKYGIKVFIETGTAGGDSIREASKYFQVCHSIEIVEGRSNFIFGDNVTLHTGDSANLLKDIAKPYKGQRIVFWLDAHWSEPHESPEGVEECPLLREIDAIKGHDCLILIDDARLFLGSHPWPGDYRKWPKFHEVFSKLTSHFPKHRITVVDDYIIAVPDYMDEVFHDEWRERFKQRYPEEIDLIKKEMKNTFEYLKKFIE